MTARLFRQHLPRKHVSDLLFLNDVLDLFSRKKSGHMSPYTFSSPSPEFADDPVRGEECWRNFILRSASYYTVSEETDLIGSHSLNLGDLLPENAVCIDLGPGEKRAVLGKTLPFLKGLKQPARYIAIDINPAFAQDSASLAGERLGIPAEARCQDFLEQPIQRSGSDPHVFFLFGGGLCNFGAGGVNALKMLSRSFTRLRNQMLPGDYLVITQDSNQSREDLFAAYDHPDLAAHFLCLPHRICRDLPTEDFSPGNFRFALDWDENKHLLTFNAVPVEKSAFRIAGRPFMASPDRPYPLVNCYKFPVEKFLYAATIAGFQPARLLRSPYNRIALHILKAA